MEKQISVRRQIRENLGRRKNHADRFMPRFFMLMASISIITTFGILATLIVDAVKFFDVVSIAEFFSTKLAPLAKDPTYGILPLINGTLFSSLIAMAVAIPIGLAAAMYLSEFATPKKRKIIKPVLELLAGVPTIVYGFFAYSFVTPLLMKLIPSLEAKNVLSPGIVMGIMIIPMVASLSEDAMRSVPNALREGAYGLGSTKLEVTTKVVLPAAISGIIASFVLAISRAIGETMIVVMAAGLSANLTANPLAAVTTVTVQIATLLVGDQEFDSPKTLAAFALGLLLFVVTLALNVIALYVVRKYREEYE